MIDFNKAEERVRDAVEATVDYFIDLFTEEADLDNFIDSITESVIDCLDDFAIFDDDEIPLEPAYSGVFYIGSLRAEVSGSTMIISDTSDPEAPELIVPANDWKDLGQLLKDQAG